ncbi:MAG: ABC transporter substrate-binding protein [Candidatus Competibacteraceae bacterium]
MKKLTTALFILGLALLTGSIQAKEWKEVRIAIEGAYPPFSSVDKEGNLQGFDVDIAKALCEAMKVQCKLIKSDWDGIIPGLLARKFDAIISSMSATEERKQTVDFSNKYYQVPARFVRKKGSKIEITPESLKGKTVGVQRATIHDKYLTDNYGNIVKINRYDTQDAANQDMLAGRVDLLLADYTALLDGFLNTPAGKDFEVVGPPLTDPKWFGEGVAVAVRKQDKDLREMFNKAIAAIRADGTYKKIQDKYFDFDIYGQ